MPAGMFELSSIDSRTWGRKCPKSWFEFYIDRFPELGTKRSQVPQAADHNRPRRMRFGRPVVVVEYVSTASAKIPTLTYKSVCLRA